MEETNWEFKKATKAGYVYEQTAPEVTYHHKWAIHSVHG